MNKRSSEQPQTVVGWIFGGGFTFLDVLFLTFGGSEFRQGLQTKEWPAAAGGIVDSKVTATPGTNHDYTVNVRYSYEVDGQKFEGDRLRFGNESHNSWASAMEEQSLFPPGKEVQVNYDPTNPSRSVLIKGIGLSWMAMALGLMALVIGLVVMFHMVRSRAGATRVGMPGS